MRLTLIPNRDVRTAALACVVLALGLASHSVCAQRPPDGAELPAFTLTAVNPDHYKRIDFEWVDAPRQRAVPVRLYWPIKAETSVPAGKNMPMVVFSHGMGGSREGYSYLGSYWAAQGYASLHVQHVGSDKNVWWGNPLGLSERLKAAATEQEAVARVQDLRFALDQVLASAYGARIDAARLVVAGHSYGATTAMLTVGADVQRDGHSLQLQDPRYKAAIFMSSPPLYGQVDSARALGAIRVPSLHVTATHDVIRVPGHYSGAQDRVAVFEAMGSEQKWLAVYDGGSHSIFTDRMSTGGAQLNPKVKAATRELTVDFFRTVFERDTASLPKWGQTYGEILARYVAPSPRRQGQTIK